MIRQPGRKCSHLAALIATAFVLVSAVPLQAAAYSIFKMNNFSSQELRMQAFTLASGGNLDIEITGARHQDSDQMYALGWILDSHTREVVWSMSEEATRRVEGDKKLRQYSGVINLAQGDYEAYFFAGNPLQTIVGYDFKKNVDGLGDVLDLLGNVFDEEFAQDGTNYNKQVSRFNFELSSDKQNFRLRDDSAPQLPNQFISLVRPRNLSDERAGFIVTASTDLIIYAIGEFSESDEVFMDGARIINAKTREMVWAMERWNTDWCGGALKNRCFHDVISLAPGEYILNFWTDDSHSFDSWNGTPPYDPYFWGVTLALTSSAYLARVKSSDIEDRKEAIVQIIKVGDDANLARDFELKSDLKTNIYAIGEGRSGIMYDYGWIEDASSGQIVWKMLEEKTTHAGGALKNRAFDGILNLPKGKYILRYKSDGSHSFGSWNAAQPADQRHYGITIYSYDEKYNPDLIIVGPLRGQEQELHPDADDDRLIVVPDVPDAVAPENIQELLEAQEQLRDEYLEEVQNLREEILEGVNDLENLHYLKESLSELHKEYQQDLYELQSEHRSFAIRIRDESVLKEFEKLSLMLDEMQKKKFSQVDSPSGSSDYIVYIAGVGDNANLKASFSLSRPTRIRIHAVGEGMGGAMYDYGWIAARQSGEVVWEMTYKKTQHAGGAAKNRVFDSVIMLDKGDYEVYYVTDDSHSYESWNDYAPSDPAAWGITIKPEK